MNLPNLISIARLLSAPLIVWLILDDRMVIAFWVFIAAGASDAIDGYIARILKARTELGTYLDPLADKALLVAVCITLGQKAYLESWIVILVVSRDVLIIGGAMLMSLIGKSIKMQPITISKLNTVCQIMLILLVLGCHGYELWGLLPIISGLTWAVALTTLLSGAMYIKLSLRPQKQTIEKRVN
ncbi:MAG: CDP-alcohol phosphatidyltransferase family protein [Alphaproteobacteria bacterium]|jgi:cardiolipin synthase (CMP-forming)|nr:CDP-alcohol phosphatidyltransferase family protein [Alphaproteobacteria bacterium]MBT5389895.1 CDP-alcohol phosphatidyltransferase family protein [Alphaproteobacteria bacterium]MBT5540383.1 CDP-alcohol phosphatidyltransferase family protein [Alphaproteobacteria bacterium]MBT5654166.1 CDP-alcohol phosphatidyltransferase family protein [Alphaproteobacteria bacterium]